MFCAGTNVVFRKDALTSIGGFDESSITEDFATSLILHLKGYKSCYYNHTMAFGMGPESLTAYFKQQARWATGTINVFTKVIRQFFKGPCRLSFWQWWEYSLAGTYYFIGWAFFAHMLCPIAYLCFQIPSYSYHPEIFIAAYVPYFVFSMIIFYSTMKNRYYKAKDIYFGSILALISFPVLMKSAIYGLIGKKMPFVVTTKGKTEIMKLSSL